MSSDIFGGNLETRGISWMDGSLVVPLISTMSLALFLSCSLSGSWLWLVYVSVDHWRLQIEDRGSPSVCCLNTARNRDIDISPLSEIMSDWSGFFVFFVCVVLSGGANLAPRHYHFHWPRVWCFFLAVRLGVCQRFYAFCRFGLGRDGPLLLIIIVSGR